MPFKRKDSDNYYVAPTVRGYGRLPERSTGTSDLQEAKEIETMLKALPRKGYGNLVEKFIDNEVGAAELFHAWEESTDRNRDEDAPDPVERLMSGLQDPLLQDVVEEVRPKIKDERVRAGLDQLIHYSEADKKQVRFSWIQNPRNIEKVCEAALNDGRKPNSVLRSLYRAIADLLKIKLGRRKRQEIIVDVSKPGEDDKREVYLPAVIVQAIVRACRERGFPLPIVALFTGVDRGPLLRVVSSYWDSASRVLTVPDFKATSRFRTLPVPEVAALVLDEAAEGRGPMDRLFPLTDWEVRDQWEAIREQVGQPDLRFKDLRHAFAALYLKGGGALNELKNVMGHQSAKTTMRYLAFEQRTTPERMAGVTQAAGVTLADLDRDGEEAELVESASAGAEGATHDRG